MVGYNFLEGLNWSYSGENNWIDHIEPTGNAISTFRNDQVGYGCGVANDAEVTGSGMNARIGFQYSFFDANSLF